MAPNPYPLGPVVGVELYKNDAVVVRKGFAGRRVDWTRGDVQVFSKRSRERLAFIAANTGVTFDAMITLTYPNEYPSDGTLVKKQFKAMLQALRRRARGELSHLWFIEFQERGAPHYHILAKGIRVDKDTKLWLSRRWYEIVDSGDTKHLSAGTRLERIRKRNGAARYAVKYCYKMRQKRVPEQYQSVGRFWGHSKDVTPQAIASADCTADDILAGLELGQWPWLRGETIWYSVLYGTSKMLTKYLFYDTLALSVSDSDNPHSEKET